MTRDIDAGAEAAAPGLPAGRWRLCLLADAGSVHTVRWASHFARAGHDVHVFSLRPAVIPGVLVHHLVAAWPGKSGYLTVLPRLMEMLRHLKPDLVHAHYLTSYGLLGVLAGARPLAVSMWGSDVLDFPARSPVHGALVRFVLHRADAVMSTSEAMVRAVGPWLPAGREVAVTPFGVDVTRYRPLAEPIAGPVVIGASCHLQPVKGLDRLLRAAAAVIRRPDGPEVRVRIVGEGRERGSLMALAASLGIADRVEWLGWLDGEAHAEALRSFSVLAAPSHRESFGVAALEAAASGVPVVASRVSGFEESMADGVSGVLVPVGDDGALTAALAEMVDDPGRRVALGRSAREWVCRTFAWEVTAQRMTELYAGLIRRPS
jgi:glycosyltransferase involved in cell wall biosynthesis